VRVLYVENHAEFARVACAQFLLGHEVLVTPSLQGAREHLASGTFSALLVDFDLDDGKGDELVREVRATGWRGAIVAVSATEQGNLALLDAGADVAVPKARFGELPRLLHAAQASGR
jgi:DNA-binding response OmpR family regulator